MKNYILVIDSGLGGVSLLNECIKKMPHEHFLYVADNKNSPYGNKTKNRLNKRVLKVLSFYLKTYNIKLILIACNTLTATSIAFFRKKINLPFVGVEPAIKPAVENKSGTILVLTTYATLQYNQKLQAYKNNKKVFFLPLKKLAKKIDANLGELETIKPYICKLLKPYKHKNVGAVVLGCTHYLFIKKQIEECFNNTITFYETSEAVGNRVEYLLKEKENLLLSGEGSVVLQCTKQDKNFYNKLISYVYKKNE